MTSSRHLTSQERKDLTVRAVVELCGQQDPARITTASIAERMKVTQGALFRHFANKDAIWRAVIEWVAERVMRRLDAAVQDTDTSLAALEAMFMTHIDFIVEHPGVPRMLLGQLQRAEPTSATRMVRALLFLYRERLEAQLMEGRASGELRADLNIEAAATQFIGAIQGLVIQSMMAGNGVHIADQAADAFILYRHSIETRVEEEA